MGQSTLTAVTRTQGATQALKDGTVRPAGWTLNFEEVPVLIQAFRRMVRSLDFDVTEMAFTTYLVAKAHGKPFTALPVFLVRGFHHGAIVRAAKSDDDVVAWIYEHCDPKTFESINERLSHRGIRDDAHFAEVLPRYPLLAEHPELRNWFEILELDDMWIFDPANADRV